MPIGTLLSRLSSKQVSGSRRQTNFFSKISSFYLHCSPHDLEQFVVAACVAQRFTSVREADFDEFVQLSVVVRVQEAVLDRVDQVLVLFFSICA